MRFVFLNQIPINQELIPILPKDWIGLTNKEYDSKEYDKYDNKHFAFSDKLCSQVYNKYKYWERNESHSDFFNKLNDVQKLYFSLINFESQIGNGGLYQFLSNQPELSIVVLDGMQKVGMNILANDYKLVLNKFFGEFNTTQDLKDILQNHNKKWAKNWNSFFDGDKKMPEISNIEKYFDSVVFIKEFHKRMEDFVISNQSWLFVAESN